jgi:hypothetical protein
MSKTRADRCPASDQLVDDAASINIELGICNTTLSCFTPNRAMFAWKAWLCPFIIRKSVCNPTVLTFTHWICFLSCACRACSWFNCIRNESMSICCRVLRHVVATRILRRYFVDASFVAPLLFGWSFCPRLPYAASSTWRDWKLFIEPL